MSLHSNTSFTQPHIRTHMALRSQVQTEPGLIAVNDPGSKIAFHSFLRERFGQKYDNIMDRYGAVDVIWNRDETDIVDVTTPEEYLRQVDEEILRSLAEGKEVDWSLVPTAQLLLNLARAEASYLESLAHQRRHNPEYLRSVIEFTARHREELIPDVNGDAPNIEQLFKNPDFLATMFRYAMHNMLLVLGQWTLVARYLDDLMAAEEKHGYSKAFPERQAFMDGARDVVEQAMDITARVIQKAIRRDKKFQHFWVRLETYKEKWTGAKVEIVSSPEAEKHQMSRPANLYSAMYRFALFTDADREATEDLLSYFSTASSEELEELDDHLIEEIIRLQSFFNFYKLLGYGDKGSTYRADQRLHDLKRNSEFAQNVLKNAAIERHIKGISSFSCSRALNKIWKEVDNLTHKRYKTTLEKLVGYGELPPPRIIPRRTTRSQCFELPKQVERRPASEPTEPPHRRPEAIPEHEPVKLNPISYLSEEHARLPPVEETPVRIGPKIKTVRKIDQPDSGVDSESTMIEKTDGNKTSIQFLVKKRVYEVFERIFKGGQGVVEQDDFDKAMCSIGCKKEQGAGSRIWYYLPPNNQPFIIHQIHGKAREMSAGFVSSYRKALETLAGWSIETFVLSTGQ